MQATAPPGLLTAEELNGLDRRRGGRLAALARGVLLPVLWAPSALAVLIGVVLLTTFVRRNRGRDLGRDFTALEAQLTLAVIPVVSILSSVGAGWAFFVWSNPPNAPWLPSCGETALGCLTNREAGFWILTYTLGFGLALILAFLTMLRRHQSGRNVLPFEPGTPVGSAIDELMRLRRLPAPRFLPSRTVRAARLADKALAGPQGPALTPGVTAAFRALVADARDREQLVIVGLVGLLWLVVPAVIWPTFSWQRMAAVLLLSYHLLLWAAVVSLLVHYIDHLRWGRRIQHLRGRAEGLDGLVGQLLALADRIRPLLVQSRGQQPPE